MFLDKNNSLHNKISVKDIAQIGVMLALIEVSKFALQGIPNVELTSFWLMMFTLYLGTKVVFVIPAFIILEGCIYGFGIWWIMYIYAWPLLVLITWLGRKKENIWYNSLVSGIFGLSFGLLCSIPYFVMGLAEGGIAGGLRTAFTWWVAGIPWDILHGISNFAFMMILYTPIRNAMMKLQQGL